MPKVTVLDMAGKEVSKIDLSDAVFGIEPNKAVMHDMVKNYLYLHWLPISSCHLWAY